MSEGFGGKIVGIIESMLVVIISLVLFLYIVQPVLVSIHPMFAFQGRLSSGRYPDTPVGIAAVITALTVYFIFIIFKELVISHFSLRD